MRKYTYNCTFEGLLAKYYDFFFWNDITSIAEQVNYLDKHIKKYLREVLVNNACKLLDVGCGTGVHALEFLKRNYNVWGVDISSDMISVAKNKTNDKNIQFEVKDMCQYYYDTSVDVVISMSHVIGYQYENKNLYDFLININKSMRDNGIFLFNFYHAPALREGKLELREKCIEDDNVCISRYSSASNILLNNELELKYKYVIEEDDDVSIINLTEKMRYFSIKELEFILQSVGFEVLDFKEYMSENPIDIDTWNGFCVARKRKFA